MGRYEDATMFRETETMCKATKAKAWFLLFRPWSYTATLVPFLVAAAPLASYAGKTHRIYWGHWAGGLLVGLLFQATVNLLNTWGDERSGVDDVPGAIRTTPQVHDGLVSMRAVLAAAATCAALACLGGLGLCFFAAPVEGGGTAWKINWELLVAGFIGFLGSTNYSTGIKFKYRGLGVPFVSFLMGPLEMFVALTLLLPGIGQKSLLDILAIDKAEPIVVLILGIVLYALWSLPVAALVGVIMHGNDMRDIPTDRAAGIVTLASRLGPRRALGYYRFCHVAPYVVWTLIAIVLLVAEVPRMPYGGVLVLLLPYLCLPLTKKTLRTATRVYRENPECPKWRGLERASGGIHFVFGFLYAAAVALVFCLSR